jgi:hypothetical protein
MNWMYAFIVCNLVFTPFAFIIIFSVFRKRINELEATVKTNNNTIKLLESDSSSRMEQIKSLQVSKKELEHKLEMLQYPERFAMLNSFTRTPPLPPIPPEPRSNKNRAKRDKMEAAYSSKVPHNYTDPSSAMTLAAVTGGAVAASVLALALSDNGEVIKEEFVGSGGQFDGGGAVDSFDYSSSGDSTATVEIDEKTSYTSSSSDCSSSSSDSSSGSSGDW